MNFKEALVKHADVLKNLFDEVSETSLDIPAYSYDNDIDIDTEHFESELCSKSKHIYSEMYHYAYNAEEETVVCYEIDTFNDSAAGVPVEYRKVHLVEYPILTISPDYVWFESGGKFVLNEEEIFQLSTVDEYMHFNHVMGILASTVMMCEELYEPEQNKN